MSQVAVLTGDLIGSTEAGAEAVDRTIHTLEWIATSLQSTHRSLDIDHTRFTRFRGDGWQAVILPAPLYFRATAFILSHMRLMELPLETRIGIGIGTVDHMGKHDLSDASGKAFIHSGHALDGMRPSDRLTISGLSDPALAWHQAALETLAHFSARWSREQAEAIHRRVVMDDAPLHQIATGLGISRQALSSRLAVAGEKPLMALIRATEATP